MKKVTDNRSYLFSLRSKALYSEYWTTRLQGYYSSLEPIAPMLKDELFLSLFQEEDIVTLREVEERLGRSLKVEDLAVVPFSVDFLLLGNIEITETETERDALKGFEEIIDKEIRRGEKKAVNNKIRALNTKLLVIERDKKRGKR